MGPIPAFTGEETRKLHDKRRAMCIQVNDRVQSMVTIPIKRIKGGKEPVELYSYGIVTGYNPDIKKYTVNWRWGPDEVTPIPGGKTHMDFDDIEKCNIIR